jgi:hypothetical protein
MEEPHNCAARRIDSSDIRSLIPVAEHTRVGQVGGLGLPAMLATDDVIDL